MPSTDTVSKSGISSLNLYQKLAAITGEIGTIKKDGRNKDQGYAFIEYAAVAGELRKLFAKYNVVIVPRMPQHANQQRDTMRSAKGSVGYHILIDFTYTVVNADNPDDKFTVTWTGEATAWDDKGTNKAATSALKYYLMRQFNISEKGDDPDADTPKQVASEPKQAPAPAASKPGRISPKQLSKMQADFTELGIEDRQEKLGYIAEVVGREVASSQELSLNEARQVIDRLESLLVTAAEGERS